MNADQADLSRHEGMALALYASAFTLGSATCAFATAQLLPDLPASTCAALPAGVLGLAFWFAFKSRASMALLLGSLSARERAAGALVLAAVAAAPSMLLRSWAVIPGLLALQVPMVVLLANETAFARYYALNGLTCAVVAVRSAPAPAWALVGSFAALLVVTLACDRWHFTLERTPVASPASPLLPVLLACRRLLVAVTITLPLTLLTPETSPIKLRTVPRLRQPSLTMGEHDYELILLKLFLQTMLLVLVLVAVGVLIRIYRKLRQRRQQDLSPETIGVPVGLPHAMDAPRKRRLRLNMHDPRDIIVFWYGRLSDRLKPTGLERIISQTPDEYRQWVSDRMPRLAPAMARITERFVAARYDAVPVTRDDAERFRAEVEFLLDDLRKDLREAEQANPS